VFNARILIGSNERRIGNGLGGSGVYEDEYLVKCAKRIHEVFERYGFKWGREEVPSKEEILATLKMLVEEFKRMAEGNFIETGRIRVVRDNLSDWGYSIYVDIFDEETL